MTIKKCTNCKKPLEEKEVAFFNAKQVCNKCYLEMKEKGIKTESMKRRSYRYDTLIRKYLNLQTQKDNFDGSILIQQFRIVNSAYEIMRRMDPKFTYSALAKDLKVNSKQVRRLLCFRKATKEIMKLIKAKKISANKVMIVLYEKPKELHMEIIEWAIETNASNYQIHQYRTKNIKSQRAVIHEITEMEQRITQLTKLLRNKKTLTLPVYSQIRPMLKQLRDRIDRLLEIDN